MNAFGVSNPKIIPLELSENHFQLYSKISKNYDHTFLLESLTDSEILAEISIIGFDPKIFIKGYTNKVEITKNHTTRVISTTDPFLELQKLLRNSNNQQYRYLGGAVGMVNYDAVRITEDTLKRNTTQPIMEFGIYDDGIIYDNIKEKLYYFYYDENRFEKIKTNNDKSNIFHAKNITPNMTRDEFAKIVNTAKQYIYDGDIFQVVLSRKFTFDVTGDSLTLYKTLRHLNPSPYMYHLKHDNKTVIGASPEMLVRITGSKVETFPIAGTRKVSQDEKKNRQLAKELLEDEKELAEHTMLVDLGRNDIGRVCKYGTVHAESLMQIKRFSHVQHIVTHLIGDMNPQNNMFDAFKAVFPAGTVTGAPKVRAMEIIDELESETRGTYAGAIGYFSYNGCCDFAIAIRSIFLEDSRGFVQSGAGIVSDSIPENEFKETEHKAGAMLQALREASS